MMLNCGTIATMFVPWKSQTRIMVLASRIDTEQLRTQLDQLHFEAANTTAKANKARLRLMRLSETAEKLQRQAVICVQAGKESDARELLFQKKKAMQALEKSKSRIELLDELSTKLNEAISVKETELVETTALDLEVDTEDATPVWIVSPQEESTENWRENGDPSIDLPKIGKEQELQVNLEEQADLPTIKDSNYVEGSLQVSAHGLAECSTDDGQHNLEYTLAGNENDLISSLKGITSYEDFLEHVDQQLNKIEAELVTVVRFSTLLLEGEERPKNLKVQQTMELLEAVHRIRDRISVIMQTKVEIR